MAYTLNDFFRPMRLLFRVNGSLVGILLGLFLLGTPRAVAALTGTANLDPTWPLRMAGAVLLGFGLLLLLASRERIISLPILVACTVTHALIALVMLLTYLQRELAQTSWVGISLFGLLFLLCLVGAVSPLRYIRTDYPLE